MQVGWPFWSGQARAQCEYHVEPGPGKAGRGGQATATNWWSIGRARPRAGLRLVGLPAGIQIVGPYLHDRTVTAFAQTLTALIGGFTPPPAYAAAAA